MDGCENEPAWDVRMRRPIAYWEGDCTIAGTLGFHLSSAEGQDMMVVLQLKERRSPLFMRAG